MSFRPIRIVKSYREHFMSAVDDEFAKFELKERAFRQADREERAAELGLPVDRDRPSIRSDERVFEAMKDHA
jgi:hypothetical protein